MFYDIRRKAPMPTLEWIGKSKVINHHQEVPFRVLERKYSFDENGACCLHTLVPPASRDPSHHPY